MINGSTVKPNTLSPPSARPIQILDPVGLHLRVAAGIAKVAGGFNAVVMLEYRGQAANARSVLALVSLGAGPGSVLWLTASGPEAREAVEAMGLYLVPAKGEEASTGRGVDVG